MGEKDPQHKIPHSSCLVSKASYDISRKQTMTSYPRYISVLFFLNLSVWKH